MNKTAIKNFAVWARRKLISEITYKAGLLGITEKGIVEPLKQSTKGLQFFDVGTKDYTQIAEKEISERNALVFRIKSKEKSSDYQNAFQSVVEEVAYTWFNRSIAVRFMEVNDYLPSRIRVLSSENTAKSEPDFVTTPFDTDLIFSDYDRDRIMQLKDENKLDELFRMLFIKQCNKLNDILPELFEKTDDYTELLLNISFTDKDGVVYHLVHDIEEKDFKIKTKEDEAKLQRGDISEEEMPVGQVEIIGWLYQYYIAEPKDVLINAKNRYITTDIPFVTQLFTPDWIVRYMVENSLGRLWIEGHPNDGLKSNWKYYLDEAEQEPDVKAQLEKNRAEYKTINPEDIKVIDPCMGSGHILVYAFDVLIQIYESYGYTQRDAASKIIENNLYGLDIDDRAYQLAYFAVMMKARQYNRRILDRSIRPNLCAIQESNGFNPDYLGLLKDDTLQKDATHLLSLFTDAKEYGSILNVDISVQELTALRRRMEEVRRSEYDNFFDNARRSGLLTLFDPLLRQAEMMAQKYDTVITNPPYLSSKYMPAKLKDYVEFNYADYKSDMFSVFMIKSTLYCKPNGQIGMITPYVWMFISSYEQLRAHLMSNCTISSLVQLEYNAFEAACVPVCTFTIRNNSVDVPGEYIKLSEFKGIDVQAPKVLDAVKNRNCGYRFTTNQNDFANIPGNTVAYWVEKKVIDSFKNGVRVDSFAAPKQGLATADNNRFLRLWFEVELQKCYLDSPSRVLSKDSKKKWFPYNKGGGYKKWFGNNEYLVNWKNDGFEICNFKDENGKIKSRPQNMNYFFKPGLSWCKITSSAFSMRYIPQGFLFDVAGCTLFVDKKNTYYILGYMNSIVNSAILSLISPTLNFEVGHIASLPVVFCEDRKVHIEALVKQNIKLCKDDWDSYETSWDFEKHPLIKKSNQLSDIYSTYSAMKKQAFLNLKGNEEELNNCFIEIYGLQGELDSSVNDEDIIIGTADYSLDMKSLISYAVGCMFGRYSLDIDGVIYAGGDWDDSKYTTYAPDEDNCIPITDEEYFEDDIVGRFIAFVKTVYGAEKLEENLDFIAKTLSNKGVTSREIIRNYFINDFFDDHCNNYTSRGAGKRPVYWLFDSGKSNGFKALIYMHRYNADTIGNLRIEYLHRMQKVYDSEISRMQETIDNSTNTREVAAAEKRKEKLIKQLKETKDYDAKVAHLAVARIELDLDDGVKVNYEKVQTGTDGKKLEILGKI